MSDPEDLMMSREAAILVLELANMIDHKDPWPHSTTDLFVAIAAQYPDLVRCVPFPWPRGACGIAEAITGESPIEYPPNTPLAVARLLMAEGSHLISIEQSVSSDHMMAIDELSAFGKHELMRPMMRQVLAPKLTAQFTISPRRNFR